MSTVLAVLSREFAAVNVLFGIARDLRTGRLLPVIAATYAPAVIAFFWIRRYAAGLFSGGRDQRASALDRPSRIRAPRQHRMVVRSRVRAVLELFRRDVFGGLSVFLLTTLRPWSTCLREEPEWLAIVVPIVAVTVVGYTDMWRYSAFLVPALPAFWAWGVARLKKGVAPLFFTAVTAVTVATQRPWQHMDLNSYFRDWFPYYVVIDHPAASGVQLWPVWANYLAVAIASLVALALVRVVALPQTLPPASSSPASAA